MILPRLLPPEDLLVQQVLLQLMTPHLPGVQVGTQKIDVFRRLPFVFVQGTGGTEPHPELLGLATVVLEVFAKGSKAAASDVAELARWALWHAVTDQVVVAAGHLTSYEALERFSEIRDLGQPVDVYQVRGTFSLGIRAN